MATISISEDDAKDSEFTIKDGKWVIESVDEMYRLIDKKFPDGLESKRKKDFFQDGAFIGTNLCRYGYTDKLAAECHAMLDDLKGIRGYSYGFEYQPHVTTHQAEEGEWYEVYTN